ncbi:MAG: hypothetical protein ACRCTA_00670, partial [Bacilli bacterium]
MANYLEMIKEVELAKVFITDYNYQEMIIANEDGIYLVNHGATYPIIHIHNERFYDEDTYQKYLTRQQHLIVEEGLKNNNDHIKLLSITTIPHNKQSTNNVIHIILDNDESLEQDIITEHFPLLKQRISINKMNEIIRLFNMQKNTKDVKGAKPIYKPMYKSDPSLIIKQSPLVSMVCWIFLMLNFLGLYFYNGSILNNALYEPLIFGLNQSYRFFTGVFVSNSLISSFLFYIIAKQILNFYVVQLNNKKMIIFLLINIIFIYISILCLATNLVSYGIAPLYTMLVGGLFGLVILLRMENKLKISLVRILVYFMVYLLLMSYSDYNLMVNGF